MQKPIFRRVALERLSSPEQLDQLIPATTLRSWLAARVGDSQPMTRSPRRVHVPTILQMEAVECGAASLAMVLAYHGRHVPLEELRLACGVSRDGTKASNLVKAARRYGLKAKGFSLEPLQLRELPLPLIVFWNFNHFVVVEGFGKNRVALNDPAVGPRAVTSEEFDLSFTGVALALEPGPDFVQGGQRRHWLAALRPRLSGVQDALAFVVIAGLALVVPGLVIPALIRAFVDDYLVKGLNDWVLPILGLMGLATLMSAGLTWLQQTVLLRLEHRLASNTARTFFWHVLRLPIEFFTQRYGGEVGSRVALNDLVANLLSERLATTLLNVVLIIFFGGLMFRYSPLLTLVSAAMLALNLIALQQVSRRRVDGNRQLLQESGKLLGTALNGLQMIETLKAIGAEADFFTRWAGQQAKVENARQSLAVSTQFLATIPPLLTALNLALILGLGAWQVMTGALTIGMWVAFQSLLVSFLGPVNSLVLLGSTLQEVEGHVNRLEDVWHYPIDPQVEQPKADGARPVRFRTGDSESGDPGGDLTGLDGDPVTRLTGHIELREVTFGYSRLEPPLIDKLNLRLKPGDRVALVGASGSGKSTVARLVAGLFEPWSGEILFDGQPRSSWPRVALTASIALVDQDLCLFEGTLRENLTLWDTSISEAAVRQAAHDACLHEEIATRPSEYETWVGESGRNFSGGQRQRLEIARALATNPSILILDEASSALDALTEQRVDEQLRRRGCACLIIAHRLSTIRDCDEIIVLDRGRVVQRGTHAEMVDQPGMYRQLIATE